jgi:alpha-galactosidase
MSKAIKLAIIGAGSAQFSLGLVRDLCLTGGLRGSVVMLMDLDAERLNLVHDLASRYAHETGADLRFEKTTCREDALREADFCINTALAGGHSHEEAERVLLEQHGYYRGLHAPAFMRQFDLMLGVARDMERWCPDAWLIQSSNPVFEGCTLMTRESSIKVLGLCHGHYGYREIAAVLGLERERVTFEAIGFNHIIWLTHFRYRGEDAYPLIDRWITEDSAGYWKDWQPTFGQTQMSPAAIHMYQFYGLMPIGDASRALWAEPWWYHLDFAAKQRWWGPLGGFDSAQGWSIYLRYLEHNLQAIRALAADPQRAVTSIFPPTMSDEQIVPIIDSLVNDHQGYYQVNVPNHGALQGLPNDVVVELPAVIDGKGIRPLAVGKLPERIMLGVMWPAWLAAERHLAAFLTGDRRFLLQTILSDQRTRTWEQAEAVLDMLCALPGNEALAQRFK